MTFITTCEECGREFDLLNEEDAAELAYGHDCEVDALPDDVVAHIGRRLDIYEVRGWAR